MYTITFEKTGVPLEMTEENEESFDKAEECWIYEKNVKELKEQTLFFRKS